MRRFVRLLLLFVITLSGCGKQWFLIWKIDGQPLSAAVATRAWPHPDITGYNFSPDTAEYYDIYGYNERSAVYVKDEVTLWVVDEFGNPPSSYGDIAWTSDCYDTAYTDIPGRVPVIGYPYKLGIGTITAHIGLNSCQTAIDIIDGGEFSHGYNDLDGDGIADLEYTADEQIRFLYGASLVTDYSTIERSLRYMAAIRDTALLIPDPIPSSVPVTFLAPLQPCMPTLYLVNSSNGGIYSFTVMDRVSSNNYLGICYRRHEP